MNNNAQYGYYNNIIIASLELSNHQQSKSVDGLVPLSTILQYNILPIIYYYVLITIFVYSTSNFMQTKQTG